MNLSLPDASILMRGLTRLMKKVLTLHPEFNFRASLVRNTLQLDTIPKHTTVRTYGEHLLAELEQMVHLEKKTKQSAVAATDLHEPPTMPEKPKVRAMDGNDYGGKGGGKYGGGKGSPKGGGSLEELKPCRFFLTDYGCKKGRSCQWSHDLKDDKRRCFHCGSPEHLANVCPRKDGEARPKVSRTGVESSPSSSPQKERGATTTTAPSTSPATTSTASETEQTMQGLLQEANKLLKGMSAGRVTRARRRMRRGQG